MRYPKPKARLREGLNLGRWNLLSHLNWRSRPHQKRALLRLIQRMRCLEQKFLRPEDLNLSQRRPHGHPNWLVPQCLTRVKRAAQTIQRRCSLGAKASRQGALKPFLRWLLNHLHSQTSLRQAPVHCKSLLVRALPRKPLGGGVNRLIYWGILDPFDVGRS
jgi:hypothetical protein